MVKHFIHLTFQTDSFTSVQWLHTNSFFKLSFHFFILSTIWNVICLFIMIVKSKLNSSMAAECSKCLQSKLMQSSVEHFIIQASVPVDQLLMKLSSSEGLLGKFNSCFYFCKCLSSHIQKILLWKYFCYFIVACFVSHLSIVCLSFILELPNLEHAVKRNQKY